MVRGANTAITPCTSTIIKFGRFPIAKYESWHKQLNSIQIKSNKLKRHLSKNIRRTYFLNSSEKSSYDVVVYVTFTVILEITKADFSYVIFFSFKTLHYFILGR